MIIDEANFIYFKRTLRKPSIPSFSMILVVEVSYLQRWREDEEEIIPSVLEIVLQYT